MAKKSGKPTGKAKTAPPLSPPKLPNVWRLTKTAWQTLWRHKRLFIGITLIYGVLNLVFVQGVTGGTDVASLKSSLNQVFTGNLGSLASALSVFALLVGSAGSSGSQTASAYQLPLGIITSLAVIWALRQVLAGKSIRIRDTYYRGMYPLIPFTLVLLVIGLQLLPFIIGSSLYNLVITNGIAVNLLERLGWLMLFLLTMAWSVYMVSSSLLALYVVTLPEMTPLKALRSARDLAKGRRWPIILRLAWLPLILLVVSAVIMVPVILALAPAARWVFFLLSIFTLAVVHAYMYTLYRELLNEPSTS